MDLGLKGRVAVVLAASSGIGRGIAAVLAQEGCNPPSAPETHHVLHQLPRRYGLVRVHRCLPRSPMSGTPPAGQFF